MWQHICNIIIFFMRLCFLIKYSCACVGVNKLSEMKSVYSAVRTGSLSKAVCSSSLKG